MTVAMRGSNVGRHVFGVAAVAFGIITLIWHDYSDWPQLRYFVYAAAAAQIFGGAAIQIRPSDRAKSWAQPSLVRLYLVFALLCLPSEIVAR